MTTERDELAAMLREVASGGRRNKIARLRDIFDEVEAARTAGVSNKILVDVLEKRGLIFDVNHFKNACSRIRKERAFKALAQALPAVNESQSTCRPATDRPPKAKRKTPSPAITQSSGEKRISEGGELVRPPGITNGQWSEIQAKAAAAKRKKNLNSGE